MYRLFEGFFDHVSLIKADSFDDKEKCKFDSDSGEVGYNSGSDFFLGGAVNKFPVYVIRFRGFVDK
jgi:hypothetical protein